MNSTSIMELEELFPYDSYRDGQLDGMETVSDTISKNGYVIEEGACGTGKTLLALTPLAKMIRDPNEDIERIVVVTKVKQQQEVFQEEIQKINDSLRDAGEDPIISLTLTGKQDVCPYVKDGKIDAYDIQRECTRLRDNTRGLVKGGDSAASDAKALASGVQIKSDTSVFTSNSGFDSPYDPDIPSSEDIDFCPFYAEYIGRKYQLLSEDDDPLDVIPQKLLQMGLIKDEDLLTEAGEEAGMCPHSIMNDSIEEAELVIANYKHLFHQPTVDAMTSEILDESTALVVDEGHNMVPQVRSELSQDISLQNLQSSISEVENLVEFLTLDVAELKHLKNTSESNMTEKETNRMEEIKSLINSSKLLQDESDIIDVIKELDELNINSGFSDQSGSTVNILKEYASFLQSVESAFDTVTTDILEDELGTNWMQKDTPEEFEASLRPDPATPSQDRISQWIDLSGNKSNFINAAQIGSIVSDVMENVVSEISDDDRTIKVRSESVGRFLKSWAEKGNTQYFREFKFEEREYITPNQSFALGWQNEYQLTMKIRNCIPREDISNRLSELGGGVIMSATLSPLDVFVEESGLSILEEDGVPVETNIDGLSFPEDNRRSLSVNSTRFKYQQKGDRRDVHGYANTSNPVREEYKDMIVNMVEQNEGNVIIAMPSYPEAEWAADVIKKYSSVSNDKVLVDKSSENWETENLKKRFFKSGKRVLTTGARGTLTEGVDYTGDKLTGLMVCGVPIENTQSDYKKAIKAAYIDEFGRSNGFDYAFTVPAVRKARQAIGRVIRDDNECGVRVLADERYCKSYGEWDSVYEYLASYEKEEFEGIEPGELKGKVRRFWNAV